VGKGKWLVSVSLLLIFGETLVNQKPTKTEMVWK
jgi:hypothetical protein